MIWLRTNQKSLFIFVMNLFVLAKTDIIEIWLKIGIGESVKSWFEVWLLWHDFMLVQLRKSRKILRHEGKTS